MFSKNSAKIFTIKKTHKVEMLKTRPKSPKIYDSSFKSIGETDRLVKEQAEQDKVKLNKEF